MGDQNQPQPGPGTMLISDPFLRDPNFSRTAVCLCAHGDEGSVGFVINRPFEQQLGDLVPDLDGFDIPLFYGGPVDASTLHLVHAVEHLATPETAIGQGLYWGADFNTVVKLILSREIDVSLIRFFMGYSGWSPGQLQGELDENSWLLGKISRELLFGTPTDDIWKHAIKTLDESYHPLVNYPTDPQLN